MSLRATTTGILQAAPGAWACCVMGFDGLSVEIQLAPACPADALAWVTVMCGPLDALRRAGGSAVGAWAGHTSAAAPEAGGWDDLVMAWGACHLVARALGGAHFVALIVGPEGLSGQGRYVLRQHHRALMAALFPPADDSTTA